jgi:hypothetical protein
MTFTPLLITLDLLPHVPPPAIYRDPTTGSVFAFLGYSFSNFGFLYICVTGQP